MSEPTTNPTLDGKREIVYCYSGSFQNGRNITVLVVLVVYNPINLGFIVGILHVVHMGCKVTEYPNKSPRSHKN